MKTRLLLGLWALLTTLPLFAAPSRPSEKRTDDPLPEIARAQFAFAARQYAGLLRRMDGEATRLPRTVDAG